MSVSIVISVYSEVVSLSETIERLERSLGTGYLEIVLAVSPRSSLPCLELCRRLKDTHPKIHMILQSDRPGQGQAYREALEHVQGTHFVLMGSDLETLPETVKELIDEMDKGGADVVIASRWLSESRFVGYGVLKTALNYLFQLIFRILFRTHVNDLTFGFKIMSMEVYRSIEWEGTGHEFNLETTIKPCKFGYRISQIPTVWEGRTEGKSNWPFVRNIRHLRMALSVLFNGAPEAA